MRIPVVDAREIPQEFDYLTVRRVGGIAGVDERVEVVCSGGALVAKVAPHLYPAREYEMDAVHAAELLSAVRVLAERSVAAAHRRGADMYHYTIEISWGGQVSRYEVEGSATDEAVAGVIEIASHMLSADGGELRAGIIDAQ